MLQFKQGFEAVRPAMKRKADERAIEILDQHPQTMMERVPPATDVYPSKDTLKKRIERVSGKKGSAKVENMTPEERKTMDQLHKLLGSAKPEMLAEYYGDAVAAEPTMEAPMKRRGRKAVSGGAGMFAESAPPKNALKEARVPVSGATIPAGAVAPVSAGMPPNAPSTFRRNRVGMAKPKMAEVAAIMESKAPKVAKGGAMCGGVAAKDKACRCNGGAKERGAKISRIMKERGLTLGQASKYLKENPDA